MASYMVNTSGRKPDLIRANKGEFLRYDPRTPEVWERSKFLDAFAWGGSDWIDYDDISEEEAKEYMKQIDEYCVAEHSTVEE